MFSRLMSINNHLYWLITTYTGPPIVESAERKQSDIQKLNSKIEQEKKTALK